MVTLNPYAPVPASSPRLLSIDALRGFDMFWIIGGEDLVKRLAEAGNWSFKTQIAEQLEHVPWEGFRFYDLIFPLFLFLVGTVLPFSMASHRQKGEATRGVYWRIARRTLLLLVLGLLYNGLLNFNLPELRIAGVLQRIAFAYGIAAVIVLNAGWRGQAFSVAAILLGYWALLAFVPAPGSAPGDYSKAGNLAGYVDRHYLPGKIYAAYYGDGDNEGLLSTIPAVATTLLGALAGLWLRGGKTPVQKVLGLVVAGALCLAVGFIWGEVFPIIKNLWTSSFVLVAGGWSLLLLALFYGVIDVLGRHVWAFIFIVIGSNAIVIYVAPQVVNFDHSMELLCAGLFKPWGLFGPVGTAIIILAAKWLALLFLYRRKLFLRV